MGCGVTGVGEDLEIAMLVGTVESGFGPIGNRTGSLQIPFYFPHTPHPTPHTPHPVYFLALLSPPQVLGVRWQVLGMKNLKPKS
ncbi:hypothetical protein BJP34_13980 [Moorena producens PAL-8-15-08-1]|uniref:Uncharacterized protein n=1 Tax=Moorena producens PAL-8-15-08-1 TaxID=1458985 RepID=A0A1D8TSK4_9CYAN|nr:hypothetical protein BJP34_13980 [Moorena producens PAL-8-15-08-1]